MSAAPNEILMLNSSSRIRAPKTVTPDQICRVPCAPCAPTSAWTSRSISLRERGVRISVDDTGAGVETANELKALRALGSCSRRLFPGPAGAARDCDYAVPRREADRVPCET